MSVIHTDTLDRVANGGTGATTLTDNGVLIGNGTGAVDVTAAGTTGQVLVGVTGGNPVWVKGLQKYAATIADCVSSSAEVTIWTVTIPANTWADGESLSAYILEKHLNNTGSTRTLTLKVKINGVSYTTLSAGSYGTSTSEGRIQRGFNCHRVGADVWLSAQSYGVAGAVQGMYGTGGTTDYYASTIGNIFTSVTFSSDVVITITAQWSFASASAYIKPVLGGAIKY